MASTSAKRIGILAVWLGVLVPSSGSAGEFAFWHENVLGTSLSMRVEATNAEAAGHAEAAVLGEIDRLAAVFSNHDPASEFRRWQATRGRPGTVSPELFEVLRA